MPAALDKAYAHAGFGAHFVEVGVDRDTGETRVRRMLGVFAAGRILNAKTARSQMIGGMTWGIGAALTEENIVDNRYGSFVNQDLASYHVAVNADVGTMEVVFLDETDSHGSPLGSKGIGELGICGAGAAVVNAIHNATGARIRDFPVTPDKLLAALEVLDG
jgi:xanthine dehydrogenase YagR molybdenum-binding subunit